MWSFLPIFYISLIVSTTSAVADTSKSLWVPQIILLEYLPVSTTCRNILSHGQTTARRRLESGDKFPMAGIPTGEQEGPSQLPPVKPAVSWDLALTGQRWIIALQNQTARWQLMAKVARAVTANMPEEVPVLVSFKSQQKKKNRQDNNLLILHCHDRLLCFTGPEVSYCDSTVIFWFCFCF